MVKKNLLSEKPVFNLENLSDKSDSLKEDSLENLGKERIDSIKIIVNEIKQLINEREKLSNEVLEEGEKEKRAIDNFILEVQAKMAAGDIEGEKERISLRQKRVDILELQLKERISSWQDVAKLKQELREKEQELIEKESRFNMLNKILGE